MDYDLLGLLFAALAYWLLGRGASKRKKQQQSEGAPLPEMSESTEDPTLDEALAEIRRALGMEEPEPQPEPQAAQPAPEPVFESSPAPEPVYRSSDEFHRVETGRPDFEREFESRPAFEKADARLKEAFEARKPLSEIKTRLQKKAGVPKTLRSESRLSEDEFESGIDVFRDPLIGHDHRDREAPIEGTPAVRLPNGRLQTREALREAFVLKEIVGPPRALKRSIRG